MKKTLSLFVLILVLVSVKSGLAVHTSNPSSVTIAGSLQSELACPGDWQPDCSATHIVYDADDDVWQWTFSIPAGSWEYKAALNNSWDENYGAGAVPSGPNIPLSLGADTEVKFYYDHKSHWVTDNTNSVVAIAAGSFQAQLGCPGDWQPWCLRSWLQDIDGDGIYSFTTDAIPAGNYEFKIALGETWDISYPGSNVPFSVNADGDSVTITFDSATNGVDVTVDVHTSDPSSVTIAGSLQSELGCPGDWQPDCSATHIVYDADDDVWQWTFSIPAGSWEYKAALNNSWDENYGAGAVPSGPNIPLSLGADTDVKFYYDHKSHWVTDDTNSVVAIAAGSFQAQLGCPGDWQPWCLRSWLQDIDGDGIYSFTTDAISAGNYEFKIALGETWDISYPGSNVPFSVNADGDSVTITFDSATNGVDVTVEGGGLQPGDVVINEIMQNPSAVSDSNGEWFELFNSTAGAIDIDGWTISDNDFDSHVIDNGGPLIIPPGGFLILGRNGDALTNGGVTVDYQYASNFFLSNSSDEVVLLDSSLNEIDRVEYDDGATFPDPNGASMSLQDSAMDNNVGGNWCESITPFGAGDFGTPGTSNDCSIVSPGDVVINEIMQNPSAVSDSNGEWFELFNSTAGAIDINGWTISDNDFDSHVIDNGGPLIIPPGGFLILGRNGDSSTNGGVTVDYQYASNFFLSNSSDEVVLLDSSLNEIDRVEYDDGATFPDPTGASMSLQDSALNNNIGGNWCESITPFGAGDFGTPGTSNVCLLVNQPPVAVCENLTVPTDPGLCTTALASVDGGSYDPDGDSITVGQSPSGPYPVGINNVTLTVTDENGASDTCSATLIVEDQEPPAIQNIVASPATLWPPNHKMVPVTLSVSASDNCSDPAIVLVSVMSSEADNSTGKGDGNTTNDIQDAEPGTEDYDISLRAERNGAGSGRIYTVTYETTDDSGNSVTASSNVLVPHNAR